MFFFSKNDMNSAHLFVGILYQCHELIKACIKTIEYTYFSLEDLGVALLPALAGGLEKPIWYSVANMSPFF